METASFPSCLTEGVHPIYLRPSASICGQYGFLEPSNTRQPNPALQIRNGGTSRPPNPPENFRQQNDSKDLIRNWFRLPKKESHPRNAQSCSHRRFIGVINTSTRQPPHPLQ